MLPLLAFQYFPCNICNMTFTRNFGLHRHVKAVHLKDEEFRCQICSEVFPIKNYLTKHISRNHCETIKGTGGIQNTNMWNLNTQLSVSGFWMARWSHDRTDQWKTRQWSGLLLIFHFWSSCWAILRKLDLCVQFSNGKIYSLHAYFKFICAWFHKIA